MEWFEAASFVNVETIHEAGWDVTRAESIIIIIINNIIVAIKLDRLLRKQEIQSEASATECCQSRYSPTPLKYCKL